MKTIPPELWEVIRLCSMVASMIIKFILCDIFLLFYFEGFNLLNFQPALKTQKKEKCQKNCKKVVICLLHPLKTATHPNRWSIRWISSNCLFVCVSISYAFLLVFVLTGKTDLKFHFTERLWTLKNKNYDHKSYRSSNNNNNNNKKLHCKFA